MSHPNPTHEIECPVCDGQNPTPENLCKKHQVEYDTELCLQSMRGDMRRLADMHGPLKALDLTAMAMHKTFPV